MRDKRIIFGTFLVALVVGCTPTREITYDLRDIAPAAATSKTFEATKNLTLDVEPFEDIRATIAENGVLFVRGRETTLKEKNCCINAEEHYEKKNVPSQVAKVMAAHFMKRGTFKSVVASSPASSDYSLTGKIRRFYGEQEVSTSAKVGSYFGLLGALATSGATTKGTIVIEFTDLVVRRKSDGREKKLEDFSNTFSGELDADAYCWAIYNNVNSHLKSSVDKLSVLVEEAVAEIESSNP